MFLNAHQKYNWDSAWENNIVKKKTRNSVYNMYENHMSEKL